MSSSPESRLRKVIKRPATVTRTAPRIAEHPSAAALVLDTGAGPGVGEDQPTAFEEARRAAFEDGRRAGLEEAMASIEARRAESVERLCAELATAASATASARASILDEVVGDVARLTPEILEALVGEIEWPETPVHAALERALALAPDGPHLLVRLHPECALGAEEIAALTSRLGSVEVVLDAAVEPGGCVVVAGSCTIDAQRSGALERVRHQFRGLTLASKEAS